MSSRIDARGLSCPQPVLMTMAEIRKVQKGEIIVLVDTDTSKENVIRAATDAGWLVTSLASEGDAYEITIAKA
jgi:tRNA 2-thiouridine synthesizing protein A